MRRTPGDIVLAVGRSKIDGLKEFSGSYEFKYGEAVKLREGKRGSIFALGYMAQIALQTELDVNIYAVSSPLAPDMKALREAAALGPVMTLEDHNVKTGMGAIMLLEALKAGIALPKVKMLGVTHYGASAASDLARAEMGLSPEAVTKEFAEWN